MLDVLRDGVHDWGGRMGQANVDYMRTDINVQGGLYDSAHTNDSIKGKRREDVQVMLATIWVFG